MATWGSKPRDERSTRTIGKATQALPRGAAASRPSGSRAIAARTADDSSPTRRGDQAKAELREAVSGREHEFIGIAFILGGVLIGLAIYFKLAGILGRLGNDVLGFLTGLGRFVVPVALVAIGVALIRSGRSQHRFRLIAGWGGLCFAVLGLLHVARARTVGVTGNNDLLKKAGGFFGSLIAVPLRSLIGSVGAVVLLVAIGLSGLLLISNMSVRAVAAVVQRGVGNITAPMGRAAKRGFGEISTLSSERLPELSSGPPPQIYDVEAEDFDPVATRAPRARKPAAPKAPEPPISPAVVVPGEQVELDLGPAAKRGQWVLPPGSFLNRSGAQAINKEEVESRGRVLVESLGSHGVETKLVGMTVGPTVTRY